MMALSEEGQDQEKRICWKEDIMACIWKRSCDGTKTGTILSRRGDETQCSNSELGYEAL